MTIIEATSKYPALMAYITNRNALATSSEWCGQLRKDESSAREGNFADVAGEMIQAQADYGSYPYNSAMGEFLGLPIKPGNGEPEHGYYMANSLKNHFRLGEAQRRAKALIEEGKTLRLIIARDKKTNAPVRFASFVGIDQISVNGQTVEINNGKRKGTLSSNWSSETCLVNLVKALETGQPYNA